MITILKEIAEECDRLTDRIIRVRAHLSSNGVVITAERRDDSNCAAHIVDWRVLEAGNINLGVQGAREAARIARG